MLSPLNILIAYPYLKPNMVEYLKEFNDKNPNVLCFFLDSGAFTAFNTGKIITLNEYCDFIKSLPFKPWRYILLDVIGNEVKTKENYIEMIDRGFNPVPVFTHGSDWSDVDYYYEKSDFICYGGLVGKKGSAKVVNDISKFLIRTKGRKAHLLGYTSTRYLKKFKPYSCDSSTWNNVGRYGWLYIYMGNGVMKQINRDCIRLNPNQKIKEKLKLMGINLKKLKSTEGWTGSNNEAMKTGAASWVSYSIDAEKNLGTKLFLACGNLDNIKIVCDAYIKLMELKK